MNQNQFPVDLQLVSLLNSCGMCREGLILLKFLYLCKQ
jgi:hypothetical protein